MKTIKISVIAAVALICAASCTRKIDYDFLHDDVTIHSLYCMPVSSPVSTQVTAVIDHEAGTVEIAIPHDGNQKYYKLDSLKLRANLGYDAYCTPSLSSQVWNLSDEPLEVTITAKMTGNTKKYKIEAYKKK